MKVLFLHKVSNLFAKSESVFSNRFFPSLFIRGVQIFIPNTSAGFSYEALGQKPNKFSIDSFSNSCLRSYGLKTNKDWLSTMEIPLLP